MATCAKCHAKGLIAAVRGDQQTVLLEPHAHCYVAVDEHMVFPEDHSRVFLTTALVEHKALCVAEKREQTAERERGKRQVDARQSAKRGG